MKARIVLMLSVLCLAMAAFAPTASAVSGYGPEGCENDAELKSDNVVDCDPEEVVVEPEGVEVGTVEDLVAQAPESEKLAFTGSSTQQMLMLAAGLIGSGALVVTATRRFASR